MGDSGGQPLAQWCILLCHLKVLHPSQKMSPSEMDYLKQLTLLTWSSKGMMGVRKGEGSQLLRAQGGARLPLGLVLGGPSRPDS